MLFILLVHRPEAQLGDSPFNGIEVWGVYEERTHAERAAESLSKLNPTWHFLVESTNVGSAV